MVASLPVGLPGPAAELPGAAAAAAAGLRPVEWEGTLVTWAGDSEKGGEWFSYLFVLTLAREQPRCQSFGHCVGRI